MALFLGGPATPVRRGTRILMVEHEELLFGMVVEEVFGMKHHLGAPHDFVVPGDQGWLGQAVERAVDIEDRPWGLFEMNRVVTDPEFFKAAA